VCITGTDRPRGEDRLPRGFVGGVNLLRLALGLREAGDFVGVVVGAAQLEVGRAVAVLIAQLQFRILSPELWYFVAAGILDVGGPPLEFWEQKD